MNRFIRSTVLIVVMSMSGPALAQSFQGTLYKNPYCTCCEGHAAYLKEQDINLDIKVVDDLSAFNSKAGMPGKYEGCHTIMLNGYAIEGHVSAEIIKKLVKERPADVVGISLPGMPLGVPGMGGEKEGLYLQSTRMAVRRSTRPNEFPGGPFWSRPQFKGLTHTTRLMDVAGLPRLGCWRV